jgi:hypothetical protein
MVSIKKERQSMGRAGYTARVSGSHFWTVTHGSVLCSKLPTVDTVLIIRKGY